MKKLLFILLIPFLFIKPSYAKNDDTNTITPNCESAILIDTKTSDILYEYNIHNKNIIASMTKIMTLSIIYDAIKDGIINYDTKITTSKYAASMGGSQVYLEEGETHSLYEMLKCIIISSANDCAVAVSEHLYKTEELFVNKMNEKAKSLNMTNTHFEDCCGLEVDNHYSTAYDMAIISSYLINNYPEVLEISNLHEAYFREETESPFWLVNTNKLAGKNGIDGLKTGYNAGKYSITLTKEENGMRLIAITLGYKNPIIRNNETASLLDYGFNFYKRINFIEEGEIIKEYNTILYDNNKIYYKVNKSLTKTVLKSDVDKYTLTYNLSSNGGNIILNYNNKEIDNTDIEIVYGKKKNIFEIFLTILKNIF